MKTNSNNSLKKDFEKTLPLIHVIAVAYHKIGELKVFVQSWINQSRPNWKLTIIHDGFDDTFVDVMSEFKNKHPDKIFFECTPHRFNDWGHSLREIGLRSALGDFVLLTNADNYYIPKTLEIINESIYRSDAKPDVVMFNMIHSHNNPGGRNLPMYSFFEVDFKINSIDMGAAIVSTKLAKAAGFKDKSYAADAYYFNEVYKTQINQNKALNLVKIPSVLLVHN